MTLGTQYIAEQESLGHAGAVLHVDVAGRSFDISMIGLDLQPTSHDYEVKHAIANYLQIADDRLDACVIDRHDNGNLHLREIHSFG